MSIKTYKGFKKDMTCRGFQYEEGKEYVTDKAKACQYGFHACTHPLDCFKYYAPTISVFHEVEQDGDLSRHDEDTKIASTKIKIGARLSIADIVKAAIDFTMARVKPEAKSNEKYGFSSVKKYREASSVTGDFGASVVEGDCGVSASVGHYGASVVEGCYGISATTGYCGASSVKGSRGVSASVGHYGASSVTGSYGISAAADHYEVSSVVGANGISAITGDCGASFVKGHYGISAMTGDCGVSSIEGFGGAAIVTGAGSSVSVEGVEGESSCGIAWGFHSKAKGVKGARLVLTDWVLDYSDYSTGWVLKDSKMIKIDNNHYKADTYYAMKDGKVVEWTKDLWG